MGPREELLAKLFELNEIDAKAPPVVTLDEFFVGNDDEESIAVNQFGYGRPSIQEMYTRLKEIEKQSDVAAVFVGMHRDWNDPHELDEACWPYAEHIHLYTTAIEEEVNRWIEGFGSDGASEGWAYGLHMKTPVLPKGFRVFTVYWD